MVKVIIFDFDLTLFNSSLLKPYMDKREWTLVYENISKCSFYPNALELIENLRLKNIKIAIVSNSPKSYVTKVLNHYDVTIDFMVCYHDVSKNKPDPEGVHKVIEYFNVDEKEMLYIGDNDIDYKTAANANIKFVGVFWGNFSKETHKISYSELV